MFDTSEFHSSADAGPTECLAARVLRPWRPAIEAVLDDPDLIARLPDVQGGCGMGEWFGNAALDAYEDKAGPRAGSRLPTVDQPGGPYDVAD